MNEVPGERPPAPAATGRVWRVLAWSAASVLAAAALLLAGAIWLVTSPAGTAWLVGRIPGVVVTAPQGSLIGDFAAERVAVELPGAAADERIVIDGLRWRNLRLSRAGAPPAWLRIEAESLRADRVDIRLESQGGASSAPASLQSPLEIAIGALDVTELRLSALGEQPVQDLHASVEIGADGGRLHRIADLALAWDRVTARGTLQLGSSAPFETQARLALASRPDAPAAAAFEATLATRGPLAQLALDGSLRGTAARAGAEPPALDVKATLAPFAAWPLGALELQTRALDLAALHSQAPATALSGTASLQVSAADVPARVAISLANARAGRIDEGRLPLRSMTADLRARPDDPTRGEIHALDIALGTAAAAGGRAQASGQWTPEQVQLQMRLTDLAPRVLDARAPAMRVSGQASLALDRGREAPAARAASATLRGRFNGSLPLDGREQAVMLDVDADASAQRVELRRALLQAAGSSLSLQGRAVQQRGDWQIDGSGSLADFDPALWWPGPEGSAWRKGPHRLNGTLTAAGRLPRSASALSLQQLARLQGRVALHIGEGSQLGGMPVAGELSAHGDGSSGLDIGGSCTVAGSTVALRGRLAATGAADHWEVQTQGAELSHWSALADLLTPSSGRAVPAQVSGTLTATLAADGRWPLLATRGNVLVENLRIPNGAKLPRASLRWTASTGAPQAPLEVQAELLQVELGAGKLDKVALRIEGTAAEHRIALDGTSPVRPPRAIDLLHGADSPPGSGTQAILRAKGGLQFDPAWHQPLRWQGKLQQIQLKRIDMVSGAAQPAWFDVAESTLDLQYDALTKVPRAALGPGRATLPNLALRWSGMRWQGGTANARQQLEVQAEIEPYAVLPLLKRLQPDFGWGGDLVVAGRVNIRSAPSVVAEVEIGRLSGDLSITDEIGQQALELTDLRLAVDARDGVWHFTQALAGRSLGALGGAVTVRTDAKAIWPPADAPLQGVIELQIANLAAWGAWAPPGWRLQGRVHASASFGGRFGAPEYTGQITGSELGVRNLVEGVDLHDGELDIALEGETAQIRQFQARAGDGSVKLGGDAHFGDAPRLDLRLAADKMRLLGRVDRRVVVSGDATLGFKPGALALDGRFAIDEGLIDISRGNAPTLGDDVKVLRGPPAETAAEAQAPARRFVREVNMNVRVDLGRALRLRGRGLDTRLEGDLTFTAPDGRLALNGIVRAVNGTYAAYNQRLRIERGTIAFSGPLDNPRLDILAVRPNLDILVGVAITGTTRQPRVSLFSDPDMSDNARLSWLVLGRPPEESSGGDTALLQAAAMAILAGEGDSPVAQLARLNPLDTFSVHQTADGNVRNTVLTVGKQLSQRWYIGFERSLSQTSGNWQLIYRLGQRVTVRLQTGIDNSIDVIWSWRWQ